MHNIFVLDGTINIVFNFILVEKLMIFFWSIFFGPYVAFIHNIFYIGICFK